MTLRLVPVIAAMLVATVSSSANGQSLADIARREAERRGHIAQPARVITNKDLRPAPAVTPPPDAVPAADPADAARAEPGKADVAKPEAGKSDASKEPARDQLWWGNRQKALQAQLDKDQTYADALQSRVNALTADFAGRDDPLQRAQIGRDRQKALDELEALKKTMTVDRKALVDLQEEARRAGVPAGWLRP